MDRDHFMTADKAAEFGLLDEVIHTRPESAESQVHSLKW